MSIGTLVDFIAPMDPARAFRPFGLAHFVVIVLTIALPFVLAAFVRKSRWPRCERTIGRLLAVTLAVNYLGYEIYLAMTVGLSWEKALPFQLCDWAMIAIIVALLTGRERWLEVSYFWGIGGTAQAILTPDLKYRHLCGVWVFCVWGGVVCLLWSVCFFGGGCFVSGGYGSSAELGF